MILAGDVGGTKTLLGVFEPAPERPRQLHVREFATLSFAGLPEMVDSFLRAARVAPADVTVASFGIAGHVTGEVARLTNVPWLVDGPALAGRFDLDRVRLVNDLEAMAYAVPVLEASELAVLQEGIAQPTGNAALIAAGTGLGVALLHNVDGRFLPMASEGGHADFSPHTPRELDFARGLMRQYGRAQLEHVLSGPGLVNLFRFTHADACPVVGEPARKADLPAQVTASAMGGRCPSCIEALDLFVAAYGSEAGNLALRGLATAGVYVGGGIAPRILPALQGGTFLEAFRDKDPMADLLATIPVSVILNQQAALVGSAVAATAPETAP